MDYTKARAFIHKYGISKQMNDDYFAVLGDVQEQTLKEAHQKTVAMLERMKVK